MNVHELPKIIIYIYINISNTSGKRSDPLISYKYSNVTYICFDYLFEGKNRQEQKKPTTNK